MATTTRGLHKPLRTDPVLGRNPGEDTDVGKLAQDVEDRMVSFEASTLALRPSAGTARRLHRSTDTLGFAIDDGTAWRAFGAYSEGTAAAMPSAGALGAVYYQTDRGDYFAGTGTGWRVDRSLARVEVAGGSPNTTAAPWGTLTTTGPSLYSRATIGGVSNGKLVVSVAGLYRVSLRFRLNSPGYGTLVVDPSTDSYVVESGSGLDVPLTACVRLEAGNGLYLAPSTGTAQIVDAVVERVGA